MCTTKLMINWLRLVGMDHKLIILWLATKTKL